MNLITRQPRKLLNPKEAAEALFAKRAAPAPSARILEDAPKAVTPERAAANRNADPSLSRRTYPVGRAPSVPRVAPLERRILEDTPRIPELRPAVVDVVAADETVAQRVGRLVSEKRFEEAARLAKRLIDSGNGHQFFTLSGPSYEEARVWFSEHSSAAYDQKQAGWFEITPERAQVLLEANPENRQIESAGLAKRMRDMSDGRWSENGETVIVAKDALLNDGQHRCWASLLSRLSFRTVMSWGVDRASRTTVDLGTKRSVGSQLGILGEKGSAQKAAIVAEVFKVFAGRQATDAEKEEFYFRNKEGIDFSWSLTNNRMPARHARAPISAAIFYMDTLGVDREEINEFMGIVRTKLGHSRGCPAFILREELTDGRAKRTSRDWAAATVQHFILWSRGKKTYKLSIPKVIPGKGDF